MYKICGISHTALSGLVYVSGVLIWLIKRPNRSTLCLAESNGIEPSSLAQWDGFQDRLSTMLPTLQLLWLPVLISGLATPATDCNAVCELACRWGISFRASVCASTTTKRALYDVCTDLRFKQGSRRFSMLFPVVRSVSWS